MKGRHTLCIPLCLLLLLFSTTLHAQVYKMFVGTYTSNSESEGVYVYNFDEVSGEAVLHKTIQMSNPSFLARRGDVLYAVNEDSEGMVTVFNLKDDKVVSHVPTKGAHPCHISLSPKDPIAVVSNYSSGSLTLLSLNEDGSINKIDDLIKFNGSSVNKSRQKQSHIHSAFFTKDGNKVYVSDLGADLIYIFAIERRFGEFKFHKVGEIKTKLGGGPRHLTFSKDEKMLYSVLELTGEIEVFQLKGGKWMSKQILPMYPNNFKGEQGGADIKIDNQSKYIYATNRGTANLIYQYKITNTGILKTKSYSSVQGDSPRNLNISPSGKFILLSNQKSNGVNIFDNKTPMSNKRYFNLKIFKPVCVIF
ncbi:lactonase family protein [Sphingobacterium bovistauri]|uniref:Lactonase family protein n=1 Tax=Sphingobacterium bovistauri TaxID=2781959 RepID=A0ABS7ZBU5_9SPHI|nr:lactonase family protein [Sphingobacterium bovistauri]MCA5006194.1 lactonase family protein [Sphingobacterium bovistauri]